MEEILARMREKRLKYHGNALKELKKRLGFLSSTSLQSKHGLGFIPHRDGAGFTLMELLIVMVILAVLVAIASGTFVTSSRRGRDNRRKGDLRSIQTALEAYYSDKGVYPPGVAGVMTGCGVGDSQACSWGGQFKDQYNTLYMVLIPDDPVPSQTYYYTSTGTSYKLYAKLENTRDEGPGADQNGYGGTDCSDDSAVLCTYGVSSANTTP